MFVGEQGCGKTSIIRDKLNNQDDDVAEFHSLSVYCNQFTSSKSLWRNINNCLEWKHGRTYIPKGNKKLICLVDDLNHSKVYYYHKGSRKGALDTCYRQKRKSMLSARYPFL
jgi:dynein heavy chain